MEELSYAQAKAKLQVILDQLEKGNVEIDELSTKIEEATRLYHLCQSKLQQAEQQVENALKGLDEDNQAEK
ncbi:exodeoxyribonuclease VII small subunit [Algivirga pacifica]|uniref:Exodeoxyribonuclease VII small subunit n=1 Tax=Algivirga pacifica TaxID=1162670 RepID=A0ABP9DI22_9BACT